MTGLTDAQRRVLNWARQREDWGSVEAGSVRLGSDPTIALPLINDGLIDEWGFITEAGRKALGSDNA